MPTVSTIDRSIGGLQQCFEGFGVQGERHLLRSYGSGVAGKAEGIGPHGAGLAHALCSLFTGNRLPQFNK